MVIFRPISVVYHNVRVFLSSDNSQAHGSSESPRTMRKSSFLLKICLFAKKMQWKAFRTFKMLQALCLVKNRSTIGLLLGISQIFSSNGILLHPETALQCYSEVAWCKENEKISRNILVVQLFLNKIDRCFSRTVLFGQL